MADVVVTLKIMPETAQVDLAVLREKAEEVISSFGGRVGKEEKEPIAFGLVALKLIFLIDESKGGTEPIEEKIKEIEGVMSAETVGVTRAL